MFHQILLQIFQKLNKERTISAAYHVLRGKRSGQTIQDIGLFNCINILAYYLNYLVLHLTRL